MAVKDICLLCLLSLGLCGQSVQGRPVSLELSCGLGPVHVVLDPGRPLLLDCHQGATEAPCNVTWMRSGAPLLDGGGISVLANGSLLVQTGPGVEGEYSCVSACSFGALASRTIALHLASLSSFHQHPEAQTLSVGGLARFQCQVDGLPMPSITWERDQQPLPPLSRFAPLPNGVLQILGVQEEDAGSYRCVASNAAHRHHSEDATLTVTSGEVPSLDEVVIVVPPQNVTVVLGRTTVLECMAQGRPKPFVSWSRKDGRPIATDVLVLQTNLVIPDTKRHHAGVYVCRANKPKTRQFVFADAELHVLAPPVIIQPPDTVSLSRGNTARFMCNSSGEPPPYLHWLRNGRPVQPSGRVKIQGPGVLLINQVGMADAGYYQCLASNSLGTACATAKLSVVVREGLPSAPRLLSAMAHSSTTALLRWQPPEHNSEQIIGFSVHYQQDTGPDITEYQFAVNNDTTEFYVKDLLPHTSYTFYVVAYSPMGASRPSLPVTVMMLEDVPSAPPPLSLLSTSPTEIHVTWLPLSAEHSRGVVTRYRVDYCTKDDADLLSSVEVWGNETQVTLRGLLPSRLYQLRMAAGTHAGFGTPSEWTLHHTPDSISHGDVLYAPAELKVRAKMYSLFVSWQPPPNHTQISGYKLSCQEVPPDKTEPSPIHLQKTNSYYEVTNLVPDQLYEVKVQAYTDQTNGYAAVWRGRTERAPVASAGSPQGGLPPPPPSSIQAWANSSTSIWLRWERPRVGRSSLAVLHYTVRCSPAGVRNASLVSYYTSNTQEILLGALKPFTRYKLAVQSNGLQVAGPFSSTVEESTLPDRPSTPPEDVQLNALNSSSVLVSWRPPLEPNGIIVEYRILYSDDGTQPDHLWNPVSLDGSSVSTEVQGLLSSTQYFFIVGACTEVGLGPFSPAKAVYMPSEGDELDFPTVTCVVLGVCLGLLCVLLCTAFSLRSSSSGKLPGALDSSALAPQYQQAKAAPHELETLVSAGVPEPPMPLGRPAQQHGFVSHRRASGSLARESQREMGEDSQLGRQHVDAEVVVHALSLCGMQMDLGVDEIQESSQSPVRNRVLPPEPSPVMPDSQPHAQEVQPQSHTSPGPYLAELTNQGANSEGGATQQDMNRWKRQLASALDTELPNGLHSLEHLPNGSSLQNDKGHFPCGNGLPTHGFTAPCPNPSSGLIQACAAPQDHT